MKILKIEFFCPLSLLARERPVCWRERERERSVYWKERDLRVGKREICLLEKGDLSVGKKEICLLAIEISVCWHQTHLSVGKREVCPLARERSVCRQERDLSLARESDRERERERERAREREQEKEKARPGRVPANCEHCKNNSVGGRANCELCELFFN